MEKIRTQGTHSKKFIITIIIISQILQHQTQFIIIIYTIYETFKQTEKTKHQTRSWVFFHHCHENSTKAQRGRHFQLLLAKEPDASSNGTPMRFHAPKAVLLVTCCFWGSPLFFWRHTWHNPCIRPKKIMLEFMIHHPAHKGAIATWGLWVRIDKRVATQNSVRIILAQCEYHFVLASSGASNVTSYQHLSS